MVIFRLSQTETILYLSKQAELLMQTVLQEIIIGHINENKL